MTMHRREKDSMGAIDVPADKLWGAQTQRSLEHFRISTEKMPVSLIQALALTKRAAAKVNQDLGLLDAQLAVALFGDHVVVMELTGLLLIIAAVGAREAIIPVGYRNRFGHPKAEVVERYVAAGTQLWRTDRDGTLRVSLGPGGVTTSAWRAERRRYWHGR